MWAYHVWTCQWIEATVEALGPPLLNPDGETLRWFVKWSRQWGNEWLFRNKVRTATEHAVLTLTL